MSNIIHKKEEERAKNYGNVFRCALNCNHHIVYVNFRIKPLKIFMKIYVYVFGEQDAVVNVAYELYAYDVS